ncbi:MAG: hypothetical protein ABI813_08610 [Bacteroidota bacterium]
MKKILTISVAFMYLAITSGLVLHIHYCMEKQVGSSVKFAEVSTHTCSVCGMQNARNKCCRDETIFIKLQDLHKQVSTDYTITPPPSVSQEFNLINTSLYALTDSIAACNNNSPPRYDDGQLPFFILNHLLRI